MQDRVPLYPGRVTLTPVSGQANTYDLTRADQPTQEGTPLNKASLLKDTTASAFGLGTDAVPDDALHLLSRFQSGLGNEYIWAKINREIKDTYNETICTDSSTPFMQPSGASTYTMSYGDSYTVNENGYVTLTGETGSFTLNAPFNPDKFEILKGKWFRDVKIDNKIIYLPSDTIITQTTDTGTSYSVNMRSSNGWTSRWNFKKNVIFDTILGYVNSPNPDAYPPTVSDGYIYNPLGQLGDKVRIATGSYTGTGTYGEGNPNSLTFAFEPRFLYIFGGGNTAFMCPLLTYRPPSAGGSTVGGICENGTYKYDVYSAYSIDRKIYKWLSRNNAAYQQNSNGVVYSYLALG